VLAAAATSQDSRNNLYKAATLIKSIRGGSSEEGDSDSEYEEYDSEEEEYDEESEEEESEVEEEDITSETLAASIQNKVSDQPYDTLLTPPPMQQMLISISIMLLSQRIDVFSPKVVAIARAAFIGYIIAVQLFLLYVRTRVKQINNRTEITISNPLASLVQGMTSSQGGGAQNAMVKSLTSQILTTHTTIYEYDMQQIKSMQSGLLMPMVFIYFLHFRMKQMQPLLMQTATGVMNLVYSPLWQVYVLGRNLERPFKSGGMMDGMAKNDGGESESGDNEVNVENDEEVDAEPAEEVEEDDDEESAGSDDEESEESEEE
jgi:hypothetical protein